MLLIFGLRVYFRTIGQGIFHCQRCGGDRPGRLKSGRRWIHVFFIPVIPLGKAGEYVQCTECGTRYSSDVLALPTMAQMQAALPAGLRAAATAMLRAGDPGSSAAAGDRRGQGCRGARLQRRGGRCRPWVRSGPRGWQLGSGAAGRARRAAGGAGQGVVPAEIIRIGLADGALTESERQTVREIAGYLGMTPAQAVGVIALTEEGASAE